MVQFRQRLTNSSKWTLIIKKPPWSSKLSKELEQSVSEFWSTQESFEDTRNAYRYLALL